ncbi:MAG: bifunctional diaminohydroxyphosphoribosylaminopyrimidine deaminase/5-amino-6-(5-phosphoribosylamino)uracil reductase RibD, partial [Acidimicrobiales bacterium]
PAAGGIEQLRAAGVEVVVGVAETEVRWSNRAWLTAIQRQRPYLTWKFAATLDGRSAAADGSSRWITGTAARADVHRLRARHDAVMVGVGTVLADDPELTVRLPDSDGRDGQDEVHHPLRVVVDSSGRTPIQARIRQPQTPQSGAADTWIATASEVGGVDGRVDLAKLLAELFARGCRSVLLEGGPTLAGAALEAGLVDEVIAYLAPALLGAGAPALVGAGIHTISQALRLEVRDVQLIDTDVRIVGTLAAQNHRQGQV